VDQWRGVDTYLPPTARGHVHRECTGERVIEKPYMPRLSEVKLGSEASSRKAAASQLPGSPAAPTESERGGGTQIPRRRLACSGDTCTVTKSPWAEPASSFHLTPSWLGHLGDISSPNCLHSVCEEGLPHRQIKMPGGKPKKKKKHLTPATSNPEQVCAPPRSRKPRTFGHCRGVGSGSTTGRCLLKAIHAPEVVELCVVWPGG